VTETEKRGLLEASKDPTFTGHSGNTYILGYIGVTVVDVHRNTVAFINAWEAVKLADEIIAAYPDRRE
jgi:hypothetical protein